MRPLDPRLLRHARATRTYLVVCVALGTTLAVLLVVQATLLADGITAVFLHGAGLATITPTLGRLALVVVARAGVAWAQEVAATRAAAAVKSQLRGRLLERITRPGAQPTRAGEVITLVVSGLDALDAYFSRYLPQLVLAGLVPAIVLLRILPADGLSVVIIVVTLPLIPVFMALVGLHTQTATRRQLRTLSRLNRHFLDVVAGLPTLKAFGRAKRQIDVVRQVSGDQRRATMATLRIALLSALVLELLSTLSVALVAVGIGLRLVSGHLDLASALLVLILAPEAYLPLRQVGANYHASAEGLAAAADVFAIIDAPLPRTGSEPVRMGTVRFDDVSVRYPDRPVPALDRFTATIAPGEIVALTGPSGAGKSTTLAVLMGSVAPAGGTVTVDGVPLHDLDAEAWLRHIAWVPQRPYLFVGTVADNIRLGAAGASDDAVREAADRAGATDFIAGLPAGFDTVLADQGTGLSAGQRQRVALARAFLRDAPLVLLDEPTANLDQATEAAIIDTLRHLAIDRTVIVAAHRPALVAFADREITLELVTA